MKLKTVLAMALAAAFATPVAAQQAKDTKPAAPGTERPGAGASAGGFAAMDRNNDGYISRDEARDATWSNRFSELDQDNDSRLSQSEFEAMGETASGAAGATGDKPAKKQ